jgi:DNA-directed RNA polymerase specialized sigma24 family protein
MTQPDDQALATLMQSAQAGDTQAYVLLLAKITPRLRQVIRSQRRFLNADDIEDLVQDVLLSLHAVRATYDPRRPFTPWLMAITRNRLADGARRYGRRAAHEVHVEQVENVPGTFHRDSGPPSRC